MVTVYNLVFLIVREKESGIKEKMRIMGMSDFAYWGSWFVYYTLINTVMTTLGWAVICANVVNYTEKFYIWIFFWLYGQAIFG